MTVSLKYFHLIINLFLIAFFSYVIHVKDILKNELTFFIETINIK